MDDIWSLRVTITGGAYVDLYGSEDVLRTAVDEWQQGLSDGFIVIEGFTNTADRVPSMLVVRWGEIQMMWLVRY